MIKFKNADGEFEFSRVEDLKSFLNKHEAITDHDVSNFAYLISNLCNSSSKMSLNKLLAAMSSGRKILYDLRSKGMDTMVKELSNGSL